MSRKFKDHVNTMPSYSNTHPAHSSTNYNSSAFSVNAQPHEDWTQVSDLAERRRIQNRIAQRNYRKKLKRRLEDLEKRAGSTSVSPEPALPANQAAARKRPSKSLSQSSDSSRYSLPASQADLFSTQRDDGGISLHHLDSNSRSSSASAQPYKGFAAFEYSTTKNNPPELNFQAWQYPNGQFYTPFFTPSTSSSSSPQFQATGFVKSENADDDFNQWYSYPAASSVDVSQSSSQHSAQQRSQSRQNQQASASWQPNASSYASSHSMWDSQNVMLPAGPQFYSR